MRILLAGTARCGSTWAANVLGLAGDTRVVFEPDGPASDLLGAVVAARLGDYPVLAPTARNGWYRVTWDLAFAGGWPWARVEAARATGRRLVRIPPAARDYLVAGLAETTWRLARRPRHVIVKTVNSMFSLEWIARRYAPRILILRRNPLNVVSSWVVLGLNPRCIADSSSVRDTFVKNLGIRPPNGRASAVTIAAWNVGLLTTALKQQSERHPDWIVESHDALCADPATRFRELAGHLGLSWGPAMEGYLHRSDEPGFVVFGGSQRVHPNAGSSTAQESRRTQQATQFSRRLNSEQAAEVRAVLREFPLGHWGAP